MELGCITRISEDRERIQRDLESLHIQNGHAVTRRFNLGKKQTSTSAKNNLK